MNLLKSRNSGLAIAATLLFSLLAVPAHSATISDTDSGATLTLMVDDIITDNINQDWGTVNIVVDESTYDFTAGDHIDLTVYVDDGFFWDTDLWSYTHQVTNAEVTAGYVVQTFNVAWLASGTALNVYASATVDKYDLSWWQRFEAPETGNISVTVAPPSAVPIPAAAWLFGSAILGLFGVARRKKA
jgi:hypothetical protein